MIGPETGAGPPQPKPPDRKVFLVIAAGLCLLSNLVLFEFWPSAAIFVGFVSVPLVPYFLISLAGLAGKNPPALARRSTAVNAVLLLCCVVGGLLLAVSTCARGLISGIH